MQPGASGMAGVLTNERGWNTRARGGATVGPVWRYCTAGAEDGVGVLAEEHRRQEMGQIRRVAPSFREESVQRAPRQPDFWLNQRNPVCSSAMSPGRFVCLVPRWQLRWQVTHQGQHARGSRTASLAGTWSQPHRKHVWKSTSTAWERPRRGQQCLGQHQAGQRLNPGHPESHACALPSVPSSLYLQTWGQAASPSQQPTPRALSGFFLSKLDVERKSNPSAPNSCTHNSSKCSSDGFI